MWRRSFFYTEHKARVDMRKYLVWIFVLVCLLGMAGCGEKHSADAAAALMVNGTVYYSTGRAVPGEVDESAIHYTTGYAENGIPQKDGEANFDRDAGTPYAVVEGNKVVVLLEHEWIEFKVK